MELLGVIGSIAFSLASAVVGVKLLHLAHRTRRTPDLALVSSRFGMVAASAIWFAFFPPAFYRRRFAARATA